MVLFILEFEFVISFNKIGEYHKKGFNFAEGRTVMASGKSRSVTFLYGGF